MLLTVQNPFKLILNLTVFCLAYTETYKGSSEFNKLQESRIPACGGLVFWLSRKILQLFRINE